ncbi:MAG: hypothetical protein WCF45_10420 [Photobacterium halotolerans]
MIYCNCHYTAQQLRKWVLLAEDEKARHHSQVIELLDSRLNNNLNNGGHVERARSVLRASEMKAVWVDRFLGYINRWQYPDNESGLICLLYANPADEESGLVTRFSFELYSRAKEAGTGNLGLYSEGVDVGVIGAAMFGNADKRDLHFMFNGALINHGSKDAPQWSAHS